MCCNSFPSFHASALDWTFDWTVLAVLAMECISWQPRSIQHRLKYAKNPSAVVMIAIRGVAAKVGRRYYGSRETGEGGETQEGPGELKMCLPYLVIVEPCVCMSVYLDLYRYLYPSLCRHLYLCLYLYLILHIPILLSLYPCLHLYLLPWHYISICLRLYLHLYLCL